MCRGRARALHVWDPGFNSWDCQEKEKSHIRPKYLPRLVLEQLTYGLDCGSVKGPSINTQRNTDINTGTERHTHRHASPQPPLFFIVALKKSLGVAVINIHECSSILFHLRPVQTGSYNQNGESVVLNLPTPAGKHWWPKTTDLHKYMCRDHCSDSKQMLNLLVWSRIAQLFNQASRY